MNCMNRPVRQCLRSIHTTTRLHSNVDWRSPLRTLGIRRPYSLVAGTVALTFFLTFPLWFISPVPRSPSHSQNDDLPAPVRGPQSGAQVQTSSPPAANPVLRSVENVAPLQGATDNFPETLEMAGTRFKLVAWGVRTVSFLGIQVYNVGLYIPESQFEILPTYALSNVGMEPWSSLIRIFSYPLLLRIIPVRNTDYAHLRDGFIRSTTQRLRKYSDDDVRKQLVEESIQSFKELFPRAKLRKGEVLSIVQWGPELRLFVGDSMEEGLGSVKNDDLARGLMSAYLVGDKVVSPDLRKKLDQKLQQIAQSIEPAAKDK
jgi:hypothetical protein